MALKQGDLTTIGTIIEINLNIIKVKLTEVASQPEIFAHVCGKMKQRHIRLSVGDRVKIIIPQASPNLGIIKFREPIKSAHTNTPVTHKAK